MIYFIQAERSKAIKIGKANDPGQRLATLKTSSPEPLKLLGTIPGDLSDEAELHMRFAKYRGHGEWFGPSPEFLAEIERMINPPQYPTLHGVPIRTAYLAGKITGNNWRTEIMPDWGDINHVEDTGGCYGDWGDASCGCSQIHMNGLEPISYVGPFWEDTLGGHGQACYNEGPHAMSSSGDKFDRSACRYVAMEIQNAIAAADLVFAWIDEFDCHGTLTEIGMAYGLRKFVVVAGPVDLTNTPVWVASYMAQVRLIADSPSGAWEKLWVGRR